MNSSTYLRSSFAICIIPPFGAFVLDDVVDISTQIEAYLAMRWLGKRNGDRPIWCYGGGLGDKTFFLRGANNSALIQIRVTNTWYVLACHSDSRYARACSSPRAGPPSPNSIYYRGRM